MQEIPLLQDDYYGGLIPLSLNSKDWWGPCRWCTRICKIVPVVKGVCESWQEEARIIILYITKTLVRVNKTSRWFLKPQIARQVPFLEESFRAT
jgi:hypothetical protein